MTIATNVTAKPFAPRLLRYVISQQVAQLSSLTSHSTSSLSFTSGSFFDKKCFSPQDLLSKFNTSLKLTVKRSLKNQHRFFMYEEQLRSNDASSNSATITMPPMEFATLLQSHRSTSEYHYYWTSPIADVAPQLLMSNEFAWSHQLQSHRPPELLDPRGPSLWMGTAGSGTQCHYDVADNIIVQLHGMKRIRIYPPDVGVFNLHVYPDAHPKARKSQVDFDRYDYDYYFSNSGLNCNNMNDNNSCINSTLRDSKYFTERFPHFSNVPNPTMDVILQPGDALRIPAFWFHHIENGHAVGNRSNVDDAATITDDDDCAPSVSLNSFALSESMIIARRIFQLASRPLGGKRRFSLHTNDSYQYCGSTDYASAVLRALGIALFHGLNIADCGTEINFIRKYLLEARYHPLSLTSHQNLPSVERESDGIKFCLPPLTKEVQQMVDTCVDKILPEFHKLGSASSSSSDGEDSRSTSSSGGNFTDDRKGIQLLVALHLLELWAVELVGPTSVASAWENALS